MSNLISIQIPFGGFYESLHDVNIDRALEDGFNYNYETDQEQEVPENMFEADIDYTSIFLEYSEKFVEAFGDKYGLTLEYERTTSPREYNFSTDRIFALAKREEIDTIRKAVEAHKCWPGYVKANFKSCDGFWSFISNDYQHEDWTKEVLTEAQYEVILRYWINNISDEASEDGWYADEVYMMEDSEMMNWDSIIKAHDVIEKYLKENKNV